VSVSCTSLQDLYEVFNMKSRESSITASKREETIEKISEDCLMERSAEEVFWLNCVLRVIHAEGGRAGGEILRNH
jgi:hypothetical protein